MNADMDSDRLAPYDDGPEEELFSELANRLVKQMRADLARHYSKTAELARQTSVYVEQAPLGSLNSVEKPKQQKPEPFYIQFEKKNRRRR